MIYTALGPKVLYDSARIVVPAGADPVDTTLAQIGAYVERSADPQAYKVVRVVVTQGAQPGARITLLSADAVPAAGEQLAQTRDDGKGELQDTDGTGTGQFNWGAGSAFSTARGGPLTVFVTRGATKDDETKKLTLGPILSDVVKSLGDWEGQHITVFLQMVVGGAVQPPAPVKIDFSNVVNQCRGIAKGFELLAEAFLDLDK